LKGEHPVHCVTRIAMTNEQNKQLIRDYLAALVEDKQTALDKYVADPHLREHIIISEKGLPGYQLHAEDMIAESDRVVVRCQMIGTHAAPLFGVPASGRNVEVPMIIIYQVADGKIVDHWMQADTLSLMQQIGGVLVPGEQE
jgi:predicted ester cyclase